MATVCVFGRQQWQAEGVSRSNTEEVGHAELIKLSLFVNSCVMYNSSVSADGLVQGTGKVTPSYVMVCTAHATHVHYYEFHKHLACMLLLHASRGEGRGGGLISVG